MEDCYTNAKEMFLFGMLLLVSLYYISKKALAQSTFYGSSILILNYSRFFMNGNLKDRKIQINGSKSMPTHFIISNKHYIHCEIIYTSQIFYKKTLTREGHQLSSRF
jgi:hypothetical protein